VEFPSEKNVKNQVFSRLSGNFIQKGVSYTGTQTLDKENAMTSMTKKITILLLMSLIAASSAFALNLSFGASGALYMGEEEFNASDRHEIWARFERGEGIYYGVNAELLFDKVGLGLYTYFSFYEDYYYDTDMSEIMYEMMDADISLGLSYHFFGTTFFLDPFLEGGLGLISKNINAGWYDDDYTDDTEATQFYGAEEEEPIMIQGTNYWYVGAGLGINLGGLGLFAKVQYHSEVGQPEIETDELGEYTPARFDLDDLKVILGGKIIL
jgi:hypothetical protein